MKNLSDKSEVPKLSSYFIANAVIRLMKKDIFERYKKTKDITNEDWEFCEAIDWHPVDELPPKSSHIKELKKALKEPSIRFNSVSEIF